MLKNSIQFFALSICLLNGCQAPPETTEKEDAEVRPKEEVPYHFEGEPLRVGVVGLVHTHVHWILGREDLGDIEIVGIVEPNTELAQRYADQHGYSMDLVFSSLEEMLEATKPEAVTAFNRIIDHLAVVQSCAPRGIHVMVEKPLAVSWDHAQKMIALADQHKIHLLTNYETSWYGSNYAAFDLLHNQSKIGEVRRIVFNTGHPGPIEIGCNEEFLEWLTDPVLNGGGALTDFGCYGANLATWFMQGATPQTISCVTQQIKPHKYPKVEDEATILLTYPQAQVAIQASWNWSHNRKDMQLYGETGYVFCHDGTKMEILLDEKEGPYEEQAQPLKPGLHDPFAFLAQVVRGFHLPEPFSVSTPENNAIVMQILEAAKIAAREGRTLTWEELYSK